MKPAHSSPLLNLIQVGARIARWLVLGLLAVNVLGVLLLAGIRIWTPDLEAYRGRIEAGLTEATGYGVRIGAISAAWQGLRPGVLIRDIEIAMPPGQGPALKVPKVRAVLAVTSLLAGYPILHELTLSEAELPLRRHENRDWQLAGLPRFQMEGGSLSSMNALLARVHALHLRKIRIVWRDAHSRDALELNNVEINLQQRLGGVGVSAYTGDAIESCQRCFVSLELKGKTQQVSQITGVLSTDLVALHLERLPGVLREMLPDSMRGVITAKLRSEWRKGVPVGASGQLAVSQFALRVPDMKQRLQLDAVQTRLDWKADADPGWHLDLESPMVSAGGKQWRERSMRVRYGASGGALQLSRLNLQQLLAVARQVLPEQVQLQRLAKMKPAGVVRKVDFQWSGALWQPQEYSLDVLLQNMGADATGKMPGLRGLGGHLRATREQGSLELDARALEVQLPAVFRQPLLAEQARGLISWKRREAGQLEISTLGLRARADGVEASLKALFSLDPNHPADSRLDLRVDFRGGDGSRAAKYYPVNVTPAPLLSWMDAAVKDGEVISGYGIFKGHLRDFPFLDNNGEFEVVAHLRRGRLQYLPGWPALEDADVVLHFRNAGMLLTARQGRIGGLQARQVVVSAENFLDPAGRRIRIRGSLEGPASNTLNSIRAIARAPLAGEWARLLPAGLRAQGAGAARLDFSFDPTASQVDFRLDGRYETGNSRWGWSAPDWLRLDRAQLHFDQHGVRAVTGAGELFGGEASFSGSRDGRVLRVTGKGKAYASALARSVLPAWSHQAQGVLPWAARASWDEIGPLLEGEVNLDALALQLPRPLDKQAAMPASLSVRSTREQDRLQLQLSALPLGRAQLRFQKNRDGYTLDQGVLAMGTASDHLVDEGLWLSVAAPEINLDRWQDLLPDRNAGSSEVFAGVTGRFGHVRFLGRDLGELQLRFRKEPQGWLGHVEGEQALGSVKYTYARPVDKVQARFQHLHLQAPVTQAPAWDARTLPQADIQVQDFSYGDVRPGRIQLVAEHQPRGWAVRKFLSHDPGLALSVSGNIIQNGQRKSAHLKVTGESADTGAAMEALGSPGVIKGGTLKLNARLDWKDVTELELFNVNGDVQVSAKSGEFLKLDEGSARVLGFLNLRALTRYLQLDFRTLFSKGYNYDSIKGSVRIEHSDVYTHNLAVKGPSADLRISGRVGLRARDYDLVVGANPSVGDTLAIASWGLGAPQVGAAILLFNRIFKGNLEKTTQLTYLVRGSWDDPKVERIGVGPLQQKEQAGRGDDAAAESE